MSSHSLVPCTFHSYSHWLKFEPCPHSTHDHHHGHPCGCLFDLTYSTFYFQAFLLSFSSATSSSRSSTRRSWKTCATPRPTGEGTYDVLYLPTSCALRSSRERRWLHQVTQLFFHDLPWIFDTDHLILWVHPWPLWLKPFLVRTCTMFVPCTSFSGFVLSKCPQPSLWFPIFCHGTCERWNRYASISITSLLFAYWFS